MKLKSIEIQGFKSFKDKIKLKFNNPICAIVGPNGSGKSNISDAIKWVLGEQSIKSLRGNKMEDVIFSGTKTEKPLNFAQVSLVFDNSDKWIPLEYNEVNITRRVFRTGESEYYLNKRRCRLKDIRETFMNTGIGKEGYSIIGQGRIDEILSAKSEDRRFIFEEASGISKFKYRKEETLKKLDTTVSNLIRVEDILSQKIDQRNYLFSQSSKAKIGLELSNSIKLLDIFYCKDKLDKLKLNIINNNYELNKLSQEMIEKNININNLVLEISSIENEEKCLSIKLNNKEKQFSSLNNTINDLQLHYKLNEEKIINDENEILRITREKEKLNAKKENLNVKIKEKNTDYLEIFSKLKNTQLSEKNLNIERNLLKDKLKSYNEKMDLIKSDINKYNELLQEYEIQKRTRENIENNELKIIKNDEKNLIALKDETFSLKTQLKLIDIELKELKEKIKKAKNELIIKETELNKSEIDIKKSYLNKDNFFILSKDLNREYTFYKNIIENYEGFNKQVTLFFKKILKTDLSKLVLGTIADLIEVEDKYAKSINNVLGGILQNVVVEKEEDAKKLINFLKKEKIGRLTFLPVNKIVNNKSIIKINDDKIIAIASEIINCDSKYKNIINYFLGKTIIVEDMEDAIYISKIYKNYRIVTLDGDIINSWGSMVGGFSKNNTINILNRNKNLDIIYDNIKNNEESLNNVINLIKTQEFDIEKIKNHKQNIIISLKKLEDILLDKQKKFDEINTITYLKEDHITSLESKINSFYNKENEKKKYDIDKIKEDLLLSNNTYHNLMKDFNDVNSSIKEIDYQIIKLNAQSETLNRDIIVNENYIIEYDNEINSINSRIDENSTKLLELGNKIIIKKDDNYKINNKLIDYKSQFIELEKIIPKFKDKKDELSKKYLNKKNNISELNNIINKIEYDISMLNNKIEYLMTNINKIITSIYDKYSIFIEKFTLIEEPKNTDKDYLNKLKNQLKSLGYFSTDSIGKYEIINNEVEFLLTQKDDLLTSKENIQDIIRSLDYDMKKMFINSIENINKNFNKIFEILFDGGTASIKLTDVDILNSGIDIEAEPPGKNMQNLASLSGGERALTAVALLFAIFETSPSSFCILDEIDAALDEANIIRYTKYLKSLTDKTQFIIISHRKTTMEIADSLYGVTMEDDGISKVISLKINKEETC